MILPFYLQKYTWCQFATNILLISVTKHQKISMRVRWTPNRNVKVDESFDEISLFLAKINNFSFTVSEWSWRRAAHVEDAMQNNALVSHYWSPGDPTPRKHWSSFLLTRWFTSACKFYLNMLTSSRSIWENFWGAATVEVQISIPF